MASVSKRPRTRADGTNGDKWVVRYVDGRGKHRQETFTRKKEADARRLQVEVLTADRKRGGMVDDPKVREVVSAYGTFNDRRLADAQIKRSYLTHVNTALRVSVLPALGTRNMSEIDGRALADWYHRLRDEGLSPRTAADRLILFSGLWKFAKRQRMAAGDNPVTEALEHIGRVPKPKIRTLTPAQVSDILATAAVRRPRQRHKSQAITQIVVNLAAFAGLRLGEIMALRLCDIDIVGRRVHVRHTLNRWDELTAPKSRDSLRVVPIPEHVAAMIAAWIADGYIENERQIVLRTDGMGCADWKGRTVDTFNHRAWRPLCVAAGVEARDEADHFHFHALRHFAGSWWIRHRLPITEVSKLLGHADPSVTMRIYAHELMEDAERVAALDTMADALRTQRDCANLRMAEKTLQYQPL